MAVFHHINKYNKISNYHEFQNLTVKSALELPVHFNALCALALQLASSKTRTQSS